jgi:uncharacterized DUF497 family protein
LIDLTQIEGFEWDKGNIDKNEIKHNVADKECEEIFFNLPLLIRPDIEHSTENEVRFHVLGKTFIGRKLFITITIRNKTIRIISARNMSNKEKLIYEKEKS